MKGVFINTQIEYRLEVAGEQFHQGDTIPCVLTVKNHGANAQSIDNLFLHLATGDQKKLKAKQEGAFEVVDAADKPFNGLLEPKTERSFQWSFSLGKNAPVSDKAHGLFLVYGNAAIAGCSGHLALNLEPHPHIQFLVRSLESPFQFENKGHKSSGDWVQIKFKPPSARRFSMLNELQLAAHFDGEMLDVKYIFTVKKFDAVSVTSVSIKKGKAEITQKLDPARYLISGRFVDHEYIEKNISEALDTIATGF
jgi:sporulation-control protein spo0M